MVYRTCTTGCADKTCFHRLGHKIFVDIFLSKFSLYSITDSTYAWSYLAFLHSYYNMLLAIPAQQGRYMYIRQSTTYIYKVEGHLSVYLLSIFLAILQLTSDLLKMKAVSFRTSKFICDRICKNVHSSQIQLCTFKDQ